MELRQVLSLASDYVERQVQATNHFNSQLLHEFVGCKA
jgi:hypothetical protein